MLQTGSKQAGVKTHRHAQAAFWGPRPGHCQPCSSQPLGSSRNSLNSSKSRSIAAWGILRMASAQPFLGRRGSGVTTRLPSSTATVASLPSPQASSNSLGRINVNASPLFSILACTPATSPFRQVPATTLPVMLADPICLRVKRPFACFPRPKSHGQRVSYPVLTPSTACGIRGAACWRPWRFYLVAVIRAVNRGGGVSCPPGKDRRRRPFHAIPPDNSFHRMTCSRRTGSGTLAAFQPMKPRPPNDRRTDAAARRTAVPAAEATPASPGPPSTDTRRP